MAIKDKNTQGPISYVDSGIFTKTPAGPAQQRSAAPLKATTESRLKSEQDPVQATMASIIAPTDDPVLKRLIMLDLLDDNKSGLTQSVPNFEVPYESAVKIGDQNFGTRQEVARGIDRLSGISDIARGNAQPKQEYSLDFSQIPLRSFASPTPQGNWNRVSSQPVKVDRNFVLDGSFQQAFQIVLASEGGFSNHKADRGGATIYGIASRSNPREYQQIMDQLSRGDTAGAMQTTMMTYKTKYWDAIPGIETMSPSARLVAFDAAVNHGVGFTRTMISRTNGDTDAMIAYRSQKYAAIIQNDPSQAVFERGWGNRLAKLDALTDTSERNSATTLASSAISRASASSRESLRSPAREPA